MGSRGARSMTYELNIRGKKIPVEYGSEYSSLLEHENVKFVVKNEGSTTAPMETRSGKLGRIYVTIDKKTNEPVSVAYYTDEGFIFKEIDYKNHGHGIHVHEIEYDGNSFHRKESRKPSAAERRMARMLRAIWSKSGINATTK